MRRIYTVLLYLLLPFIVLRLYWKGRHQVAYRQRLRERFSWGIQAWPNVDVWLHAVSLGEVVAATPLIERLLENQKRVLVTTMTPTGSAQVLRRFGTRVSHQYVPYDFPGALRRFFKGIQAPVGIIMETELWPNLIVEATNAGVALFLANARISDGAFKQYEAVRFLFKPILNRFTAILTQSPLDSQRFIALGAASEKVRMLGNMKFDLHIESPHATLVAQLKEAWGAHRTVVIAASTHEGEELELLSSLKALQKAIPGVLLLIAPRHPERFQSVHALGVQQGLNTGLRSHVASIQPENEVVVLDSLGELLSFYEVSDYAFVGGSWVEGIGGHNVLEAIALGVPVFCGMFMRNSQSIVDELVKAHALQQVIHAECLVEAIAQLQGHPEKRMEQIAQATAILVANQGSVSRYLEVIEPYF